MDVLRSGGCRGVVELIDREVMDCLSNELFTYDGDGDYGREAIAVVAVKGDTLRHTAIRAWKSVKSSLLTRLHIKIESVTFRKKECFGYVANAASPRLDTRHFTYPASTYEQLLCSETTTLPSKIPSYSKNYLTSNDPDSTNHQRIPRSCTPTATTTAVPAPATIRSAIALPVSVILDLCTTTPFFTRCVTLGMAHTPRETVPPFLVSGHLSSNK